MEEIDLMELFNIFWKKKFVIILIIFLFILLGIMYSYNYKVPKYKSSTTLLLAQNYSDSSNNVSNEITQTDIILNQKLVSTYSELIKSKTVIKQALTNLNMDIEDWEEVKKSTEVKELSNTQVIEITYSSEDYSVAYKIANELAKVFCDKVTEIYNINNIYVVDKAEIDKVPYNMNHIKDIMIFAIIGAGLSCMIIFIISMLDTTVKKVEDVEKATHLIVLAQIPEIKGGGKK